MPVERDERAGGNTVDGGGGQDHKTPKGKSRRRQDQEHARSTSDIRQFVETQTMALRNDLSKFISRWFDTGEIAEVFTTFTDQTEPEVVKRAWQRLFYGASSLQCVQWHAFLVDRRDLAKGGNVEVIESRAKDALLAIKRFSNGSSPSVEASCLDAAARSLGISDLSDTAHISHLLDFVSYLRGCRAEQNALTRECLRGTWVTQGSNEDLR